MCVLPEVGQGPGHFARLEACIAVDAWLVAVEVQRWHLLMSLLVDESALCALQQDVVIETQLGLALADVSKPILLIHAGLCGSSTRQLVVDRIEPQDVDVPLPLMVGFGYL